MGGQDVGFGQGGVPSGQTGLLPLRPGGVAEAEPVETAVLAGSVTVRADVPVPAVADGAVVVYFVLDVFPTAPYADEGRLRI